MVCETLRDVELMLPILSERHYPCSDTYDNDVDNVRILVVTYDQLVDEHFIKGETTVLFCLDDSVIGVLCALAQEHGIHLVVSL